jgi:hypothetical protein
MSFDGKPKPGPRWPLLPATSALQRVFDPLFIYISSTCCLASSGPCSQTLRCEAHVKKHDANMHIVENPLRFHGRIITQASLILSHYITRYDSN